MRGFRLAYVAVTVVALIPVLVGSDEVRRVTYDFVAPLAFVAIVAGIRAHRPEHRAPWWLLAGAMASWTVGAAFLEAQIRVWRLTWSLTPVDTATLAGYLLAVAAFWSFARRMSLTRDLGAVLDITLLVVGGGVVLHRFVLQPVSETLEAFPLTRVVSLAYPLLDYILLVLSARILMNPGRRPRALVVLLVATTAGALTDILITVLRVTQPEAAGQWGFVGAYVFIALVGLAALFPSMADIGHEVHDATPRLGWVRLTAIGVALTVPAVAAVAAAPDSSDIDASMLLVPTGVMIVLVMARVRSLFASLSRAEAQQRHQALHDALTGLPNRVLFADRLARARARRDTDAVAVLFVDLDDFKAVNDALGHEAGDRLLQGVAERLRAAVRDEDTVARLGGDEFAVLVAGRTSAEELAVVADRVVEALRPSFELGGRQAVTTASIGAAVVDSDDDTDVLALADTAMYRAKTRGKDAWVLYQDHVTSDAA